MFLASLLSDRGHPPESVTTTASVHLGAGPTITKIELDTRVKVAGVDYDLLQEVAAQAKRDCPVSKALTAVPEVVLHAALVD
jgi:osmotically inducible protein OsmC